jgi:hypothetical protein
MALRKILINVHVFPPNAGVLPPDPGVFPPGMRGWPPRTAVLPPRTRRWPPGPRVVRAKMRPVARLMAVLAPPARVVPLRGRVGGARARTHGSQAPVVGARLCNGPPSERGAEAEWSADASSASAFPLPTRGGGVRAPAIRSAWVAAPAVNRSPRGATSRCSSPTAWPSSPGRL